MKKLVYLFVISLGIISCNSNNDTEIDNSDIVGKWNWINTDGGISYNIHETPQTTGKTIYLNLMKNYEYSLTVNGIEISSGIYELIMEKSIYSGEIERSIQIPENQKATEINIKGIIKTSETNKLDILDNNYDGIGSSFIKVE